MKKLNLFIISFVIIMIAYIIKVNFVENYIYKKQSIELKKYYKNIEDNQNSYLQKGTKAPEFELKNYKDKEYNLKNFKDKKSFFVFFNFKEDLDKEYKKIIEYCEKNNFNLVFINLTELEKQNIDNIKESKKDILKKHLILFDLKGKACFDYNIYQIPTTYLLDENLNIEYTFLGRINDEFFDKIQKGDNNGTKNE
ncbi:redoxin domain-containing protein [Peptostreptococcaceae bacterium AGR-M142]